MSSSDLPLFPAPQAPQPQLRLFEPAARTAALSPQMTLSEFLEAFVVPVCLTRARPRNLKQYRESIAYWRRLTGDPPLAQIDDFTAARFLAGLYELPAIVKGNTLADNTVRKHCVHVQYCLDRAGLKTRQNPRGQSLVAEAVLIDKPRVVVSDVDDDFSLDEIGAWLEACHAMSAPRSCGVPARAWWESLGLVAYNTGLRVGTLLLLEYGWIEEDWIKIPGPALKQKRAGRFYLNRASREAIQEIRTERIKIFPFPHSESWLHEQRRRLLAKSRIAPNRRFGFHAFRKAFGNELSKINGLVVAMALGHSERGTGDVTRDHYIHRQRMAEAMDRLPQPLWRRRPEPQLRLFE